MKRLIHPDITPIGGYSFIDPDTGFVYNLQYRTYSEMEQHINEHRRQNNLPRIDNLRMVWEAYICANNPHMFGKCCEVGDAIKRSYEQYWSGAKAFFRIVLSGAAAFVSRAVATERAAQCINCNQNRRNIGHSSAQFYTDKFMHARVGARTTKHDKDLHTCKACTCILRAKVHFTDGLIAEALTESDLGRLMREPKDNKSGLRINCWQLRAAMNDGDGDNGK